MGRISKTFLAPLNLLVSFSFFSFFFFIELDGFNEMLDVWPDAVCDVECVLSIFSSRDSQL